MKILKLFWLTVIFISLAVSAEAKTQPPDPLYLYTPPLDSSKVEVKMKEKDPRTLNEKFREKFHLPPTKSP